MKLKLKHFVVFSTLFSSALIGYGFFIQEQQPHLANQYIGLGTVGIFLVAMPLFLIKESRKKNLKNYTLTKENLEKMKAKMQKKKRF